MNYNVEDRIFINEAGNQVKYKRLVIQGYLNGNLETIELAINKEQALIYKAMQAKGHEVTTSKGGAVDVEKKPTNGENRESWLD